MNWGYSISKPRTLHPDANDYGPARKLLEAEPALRACIGCGNCSATCTAGNMADFNIRKLHTLFRRGEYTGLRKEIDQCMLCGKCRMLCPRGINTRKVIVTIKRILDEARKE